MGVDRLSPLSLTECYGRIVKAAYTVGVYYTAIDMDVIGHLSVRRRCLLSSFGSLKRSLRLILLRTSPVVNQ